MKHLQLEDSSNVIWIYLGIDFYCKISPPQSGKTTGNQTDSLFSCDLISYFIVHMQEFWGKSFLAIYDTYYHNVTQKVVVWSWN